MELRRFINIHIKDSKKYRFVLHTQGYDFINTGNIEFSFYELFQLVGLLLGCEVKEIISKENIYNRGGIKL